MSETNHTEAQVYDENREPEPVYIKAKGGETRTYTVNEMSGEQLAEWMEIIGKRVKPGRNGKAAKTDFRGMHADLINLCLKDQQGNVVPREMIKLWGATLQNRLFEACQKMNGLTDADREAEGKD